ncbi:MAG: CpsD/CapB family tyrosine-protein kinase [Candidatus Binatia bacterium]
MSAYFDSLNRRASTVQVAPAPAATVPERPARPAPAPVRRLTPGEIPSEYAAMRERILVLSHGKSIKSLVFAGCEGGEGCTQVVRNFAEMLASSGLDVLLVDAELHTADVASGPAPATVDIGDTLSQKRPLAGTAWGQGRLTVVQCPLSAPEKEGLLTSPEFASWLDVQRSAYDYVLLDAPPLLRSAEATLMGRMADGVVLVVQAEVTPRDLLGKAREQLERAGVRVLGAVLNRVRDRIPPLLRPYLSAA